MSDNNEGATILVVMSIAVIAAAYCSSLISQLDAKNELIQSQRAEIQALKTALVRADAKNEGIKEGVVYAK